MNDTKNSSMNNIFSSEPTLFESGSDIKLLLNQFGHFSGRYLNAYPINWLTHVRVHINTLLNQGKIGEVQKTRALEVLNRAIAEGALVAKGSLAYSDNMSWIDNAVQILDEGIESIVVHRGSPDADSINIIDFDEFDVPPTTEERIMATASEYLRVCQPLILNSPEVILIDPYLNPCSPYVEPVLYEFFSYIARTGKCESIKIWARQKEVIDITDPRKCNSKLVLKSKITDMINSSNIKKQFRVKLILVEDNRCKDRLHDRFLLSMKGGVRLSQGFQTLSPGRKVDAGPIGRINHEELLTKFADDQNDISNKTEVEINVR